MATGEEQSYVPPLYFPPTHQVLRLRHQEYDLFLRVKSEGFVTYIVDQLYTGFSRVGRGSGMRKMMTAGLCSLTFRKVVLTLSASDLQAAARSGRELKALDCTPPPPWKFQMVT